VADGPLNENQIIRDISAFEKKKAQVNLKGSISIQESFDQVLGKALVGAGFVGDARVVDQAVTEEAAWQKKH